MRTSSVTAHARATAWRSLEATAIVCLVVACSTQAAERSNGPGIAPDTPPQTAWIAASAGTYNSCAIAENGAAYCWGMSLVEGCTDAGCLLGPVPVRLAGGATNFASVTSGGGFHCAVNAAREAYCWGEVFGTSLGDGTTRVSATPIRVAIPAPVRSISAGYQHVCALTTEGVAFCWGAPFTPLGLGPGVDRSAVPRAVQTALRFKSISAGNTQTCAIDLDDAAHCWGGGYGTLGVGSRDVSCEGSDSCLTTTIPMRVDGDLRWAAISAGNAFTCGVTVDHRGFCWGAVQNRGDPNPPLGQLGNGTFVGSLAPVPVSGGLALGSIAAGTRQACGLTIDGAAYCWGTNEGGELGTGTRGGRFATPQAVSGGLRFNEMAVAEVSCGLTVNRNLYCWGITFGGLLGSGQSGPGVQASPILVAPPRG